MKGLRILALSGGVGGAKLVTGLASRLQPEELAAVCNTADDFEHLGLKICPDLDSVMYALAGRNDTVRGWGLENETWSMMRSLKALGGEAWFQLGDQDLATHLQRSQRLREGATLSQVTGELCRALGIRHAVWPMSDDPVRTIVASGSAELPFQHYFVREHCLPEVSGFRFDGIREARAQAGFIAALADPGLEAVLICPSNPFVSVDPILHIPGVLDALRACGAPVVAVSPIVGGQALKGPAAKMMAELGMPASAQAVAAYYARYELLDGFVLDQQDADQRSAVARLGMRALVVNTVMKSASDRGMLAHAVLEFARALNRNS